MEIETASNPENPWQVENIAEFVYFCCPECQFQSKTSDPFIHHALENHPKAHGLLPEPSSKEEEEEPEYIILNQDEAEPNVEMLVMENSDIEERPKVNIDQLMMANAEPQASIVEPPTSIVEPQASILEPQASIVEPQASIVEPPTMVDAQKAIKCELPDPVVPDPVVKVKKEVLDDDDDAVNLVVCVLCGLSVRDNVALATHHNAVHVEKANRFTCPWCSQRFPRAPTMKEHVILSCPTLKPLIINFGRPQGRGQAGSSSAKAKTKKKKANKESDNVVLSEDGEELACPECDFVSTSVFVLSDHMTRAHGRTLADNECPLCEVRFQFRARLLSHVKAFHEKKKKPCPECGKTFLKHNLKHHMLYFHQGDRVAKPFKCDECDYATHAMKYLKAHIVTCHTKDAKKYKCDECGGRFQFPSVLKHHNCDQSRTTLADKNNEPVKCGECETTSLTPLEHVNHFRNEHGRMPPGYEDRQLFMCEHCTDAFFTERSLANHLKKHVARGSKPQCAECGQEFSSDKYLVQHFKYVHDGRLPPGYEDKVKFMCDKCPSVYTNAVSLRAHTKSKHSEGGASAGPTNPSKKKQCPHCEKSFKSHLSYAEHIKSKHDNNTPHKCSECHRAYGTAGKLRAHKKSMHQRVRCDECGQDICNLFILKRHKATVHGILPPQAIQCEHCPSYFEHRLAKEKHVRKHHKDEEGAVDNG